MRIFESSFFVKLSPSIGLWQKYRRSMVYIWSTGRRIIDDVIVCFCFRREKGGVGFDVQSRSCSSIG